jgi:hypothetical protein
MFYNVIWCNSPCRHTTPDWYRAPSITAVVALTRNETRDMSLRAYESIDLRDRVPTYVMVHCSGSSHFHHAEFTSLRQRTYERSQACIHTQKVLGGLFEMRRAFEECVAATGKVSNALTHHVVIFANQRGSEFARNMLADMPDE